MEKLQISALPAATCPALQGQSPMMTTLPPCAGAQGTDDKLWNSGSPSPGDGTSAVRTCRVILRNVTLSGPRSLFTIRAASAILIAGREPGVPSPAGDTALHHCATRESEA